MSKAFPVQFFKEGVKFRLQNQDGLKRWIAAAFRENKRTVQNLSYIFCTDKFLLKMNKDFLRHDYFTDIITFDNTAVKGMLEADIFISADRVLVNAKKFKSTFNDELHRVMIHGVLHLLGFDDKSPGGKSAMSQAEEYWLKKRPFVKNSSSK